MSARRAYFQQLALYGPPEDLETVGAARLPRPEALVRSSIQQGVTNLRLDGGAASDAHPPIFDLNVRKTRKPSLKVRRLLLPRTRRLSMLGTSMILAPAAAKRQLMRVSISNPSPQSMPSAGPGAVTSGRASAGTKWRQSAL